MAQYEMNLRDYWRIIRRRRVVILVCTSLMALFSFWFASQKVPVYQASASIKFEPATSLTGLLVEVLSFTTADSIETQAVVIKSFPVLEQVAKRTGKLPETVPTEAVRESKAYTSVIDALGSRIKTTRVTNTSVIDITVTSTNPREAKDLANTVVEVYREYQSRLRNGRIIEARQFIEQRIKDVEARLKDGEEAVWAFREANRIIAPGAESQILLSLFTQIRGEVEKTRLQRAELELASARLSRQDGAIGPGGERVFVDSAGPAMTRLQGSLVELLLERNNLGLEVTETHPRLQALDDRIREVRREMAREVAAQITVLRSREELLHRQIGELFQRNREIPGIELSLQRLQRETRVNEDLLSLLKSRHQEALIKEAEKIEEVTLIRPATEPLGPISGETANTVLVGAIIGLILGLVLAFVQETLDTSIGTIEDVESYLEVPVLGIIPHIDPRETVERLLERRPELASMEPEALSRHALLVTHFDPKSPVSEAYRTLRTNIQFATMERPGKLFVVTSSTLQEGKTTTIVNLALTMAQMGQKTLLVGANLRRPALYKIFGIEREPGLTDVILGNNRWEECVRTVADILMGRFEMEDIMMAPGLDNLHILTSGTIPINPSELLTAPQMGEFLRQVRDQYDVVLFDSPPVLPVADAAILAAQVDGVILVYQVGKVGRLVLKRAKAHLENAKARVLGVVLNDVKAEVSGYATYTHYYTHYYAEEGAGGEKARPTGLRGKVAGWFGRITGRRGREAPAAAEPLRMRRGAKEPDVEAVVPEVLKGAEEPKGRYSHLWIGLLVVVILLLLLGGLLAWRFGFFSPGREGAVRDLFRSRIEQKMQQQAAGRAPEPSPAQAPAAPPVAAPEPPQTAKPAPARPEAEGGRAGAVSPTPKSEERPVATAPRLRYALEFGPFLTSEEADRMEARLNQAGFQTARFSQQGASSLYAVFIERLPNPREAQALVERLRAEGFGEAVLIGAGETLSVRAGEPAPLRGAVQLAEKLRASGHQVRVAVQPGGAATLTIRHGNFASQEEADSRGRELARTGFPNQVVRVR
jgi:capsular exopolysaccharide synthesis family protein